MEAGCLPKEAKLSPGEAFYQRRLVQAVGQDLEKDPPLESGERYGSELARCWDGLHLGDHHDCRLLPRLGQLKRLQGSIELLAQEFRERGIEPLEEEN